MLSLNQPFIFFDDARQSDAAAGRYYHDLQGEICLKTAQDVHKLQDNMRRALANGYHVAGYLSYEAGLLLEERTAKLLRDDYNQSLGWFGIFTGYDEVADMSAILPDDVMNIEDMQLGQLEPEITQDEYTDMFQHIQAYIRQGDIYQANLTFRCTAEFTGNPLSLYASLRSHALAGYGGIMHGGGQTILSFSPELFFTLKDRQMTARPMKGTAKVIADPVVNAKVLERLKSDTKQRAENLMIVDLLRNDVSKICEPSSVHVPSLFHLESYPTVHQMTSTVVGTLQENMDATDILTHIFPCGSITGAPKIRAIEIIDEIEKSSRNIYCGSMGWMEPSGDAAYNVAIRSLSMQHGSSQFSMGLGSGIVADSNAVDEWAECLDKGAFIRGSL